MRIGIDCRTMLDWRRAGESAGIGHYTYYLVKHLLREDKTNEYVLFLDKNSPKGLRQEIIGGSKNVSVRNFPFQAFRRCLPFIYSHMVISGIFEKAKLDLLHAPANSLPLFYRGPSVVTVHDLAIYDHPEWFPSPYTGALSFSERIVVPYSVRKAKRIIAVSEQTKKDIVRTFQLKPSKIDVVYEGAEPSVDKRAVPSEEALKRFNLAKNGYLLFLGTVEPRKNISAAIRAFADFAVQDHAGREKLEFVIAGRRGWKFEPVFEAMQTANERLAAEAVRLGAAPRERVRYLGYLPRDAKAAIIAGAAAFVFPSLYEGFGLPVIEAMSLGVPVIAADRASLPEICGDAAILVDPQSERQIASAMEKVVTEPKFVEVLREKARRRAAEFSWERTARETITTYEKALNS